MAEIIIEEIDLANANPPSLDLSRTFNTRTSSLSSRLSAIGLPSTIIPRPRHPLFPSHVTSNESIQNTLSEELEETMRLTRLAQIKAKEYHDLANAADRASKLLSQARELSAQLQSLADRIRNGSNGIEGDGMPPDLSDEKCLDPNHHGAYMALLPTLFADIQSTEASTKQVTTSLRVVLLELQPAPTMESFSSEANDSLASLASDLQAVLDAKRKAVLDVDALRRARGVWARSTELKRKILAIKEEITEAIDVQQWKATLGREGAPLTPESPRSLQLDGDAQGGPLSPATLASQDVRARISEIEKMLDADVRMPLNAITSFLGDVLLHYLETGVRDIASQLESLRHMAAILERVQRQAEAMKGAVSESYELEARIDSLRLQIQQTIDDTLQDPSWQSGSGTEARLGEEIDTVDREITTFTHSLSARIPLVSFTPSSSLRLDDPRSGQQETIQRKMVALDQTVRSDVNSLAMTLAGRVDSLKRKLALYSLADLARLMDQQTRAASTAIITASSQLSSLSASTTQLVQSISELPEGDATPDFRDDFAAVLTSLESLASERTAAINQACSTALVTLRQMRSSPGARDSSVHDDILNLRTRAFEDVEARAYAFQQEIGVLKARAIEGRRLTENKLHEEKLRREREEMERRGSLTQAELEASRQALRESEAKALLAAEERKRLEEEQLRKDEQARLDEAARLERHAEEAAARAEEARRRENELLRQEEARRAEEARRTEEAAKKADDDRLALEAAHRLELEEAARVAEAAAIAAAAAREAGEFPTSRDMCNC